MDKKKIYIFISLFACTILLCKCTEVDICYETQHLSKVNYSFGWTTDEQTEPDSMLIVAARIVNSWRCAYVCSTASDSGRYLFNDPNEYEIPDTIPTDTIATDTIPTDTTSITTGWGYETIEHSYGMPFNLKSGEYILLTFNHNENLYSYPNLMDFSTDKNILNQDLIIAYKPYDIDSTQFDKYREGWIDYNPYCEYILTNSKPLFYDYSDILSIGTNETVSTMLRPEPISQKIEFNIPIEKDSVFVDKVVADISGIASQMNLFTGDININKTYKMLFELCDMDSTSSTQCKGKSNLYGNIDVLGLTSSDNSNPTTGKGIMQIAIHTHTLDSVGDKSGNKIFYARINLYNTIWKYHSPISGNKENVTLCIEDTIHIGKNKITVSSNIDATKDHWILYENN